MTRKPHSNLPGGDLTPAPGRADVHREFKQLRNRVWLQYCVEAAPAKSITALDTLLHRHRAERDGLSFEKSNQLRKYFDGLVSPRTSADGCFDRLEELCPGSGAYYSLAFWPLIAPTSLKGLAKQQADAVTTVEKLLKPHRLSFLDLSSELVWADLADAVSTREPTVAVSILAAAFFVGSRLGRHRFLRGDRQVHRAFEASCRTLGQDPAFHLHHEMLWAYIAGRFIPATGVRILFDSASPEEHLEPGFWWSEAFLSMCEPLNFPSSSTSP